MPSYIDVYRIISLIERVGHVLSHSEREVHHLWRRVDKSNALRGITFCRSLPTPMCLSHKFVAMERYITFTRTPCFAPAELLAYYLLGTRTEVCPDPLPTITIWLLYKDSIPHPIWLINFKHQIALVCSWESVYHSRPCFAPGSHAGVLVPEDLEHVVSIPSAVPSMMKHANL